jgi:hypothetical protein
MFDSTNITEPGEKEPVTKGDGEYGGLVQAEHYGEGVFGITSQSAINITGIGLSLIQVTFDSENETSPVRNVGMFQSGRPKFNSSLNLTFSTQGHRVTISRQNGYTPLRLVDSTLTSTECHLRQLPLFFEQSLYAANVPESTVLLLVVLQVSAITYRPGSTVNYSIADPSAPFAVEPESGEISVAGGLDFDFGERFYNFTVLAEEVSNSSVLMTASATVHVGVLNENDLRPLIESIAPFDLPANTTAGEAIFTANASDPDGLDQLTYSLSSLPNLFSMNKTSGTVSATQSLLHLGNLRVTLTVTVSDSLLTSNLTINLTIFHPSFSLEFLTGSLLENASIGEAVVVVVIDEARTQTFSFSISGDLFTINSTDGVTATIAVNGSLDYEMFPVHVVTVVADSSHFHLETNVTVFVLDVNDNCPTFPVSQYTVSFSGGSPVGTVIDNHPRARDRDTAENSVITYSISSQLPSGIFSVDPTSGDLRLAQSLERGPSAVSLNLSAFDDCTLGVNGSLTMKSTSL